jgi:hypothetical protein
MKYSHDGDAAHAITMDAAAMGQYATRVGGMLAYLDREAVEARRERNYRRTLRKLPPNLRRFVRILRHVVEDVPGPETEHREKICKALKIKGRMYLYMLSALRENVL